jgi:CheY-like chemotaxis protein
MAEVRSMIRTILEFDSHVIAEAEDGRQAIAALASRRFDIIVTDILMPESDGIELIRSISSHPSLGIVAMSGGGSYVSAAVSLAMAKATGAGTVLRKPFRKPELLAAVNALVAEPRFRQSPSVAPVGTGGTTAP